MTLALLRDWLSRLLGVGAVTWCVDGGYSNDASVAFPCAVVVCSCRKSGSSKVQNPRLAAHFSKAPCYFSKEPPRFVVSEEPSEYTAVARIWNWDCLRVHFSLTW